VVNLAKIRANFAERFFKIKTTNFASQFSSGSQYLRFLGCDDLWIPLASQVSYQSWLSFKSREIHIR
jgi:hypothetical protein